MPETIIPAAQNGKEAAEAPAFPERTTARPPDNDAWQRGLLPYIKVFLLVLTLFFVGASTFQLFELNEKIYVENKSNLDGTLRAMLSDERVDRLEAARWITLTELETQALNRRYHQANVLLMSKIWIQYLSFITGMILAIIGAVFVLGKFTELESAFDTDLKVVGKVAFRSASPGLVMAFFGTLLIIVSLSVARPIAVTDGAIYLRGLPVAPSGGVHNIRPYDPLLPADSAKPTRDTSIKPPPLQGN